MLLARALPLAPDPLAIARRLWDVGARSVVLLHSAERAPLPCPSRWSFVGADPDLICAHLDPLQGDPQPLESGALGFVPRWIGVLPYEARRHALERAAWVGADTRPLVTPSAPCWARYPAVVCVDHEHGHVLVAGSETDAVARLSALLRTPTPWASKAPTALQVEAGDDEPTARHGERIAAAKELIVRGELYQVNLARRLWLRLRRGDPLSLYANLARRAPGAFGACLCFEAGLSVVSTSPELLLHASPRGALLTGPIKGTRPRGRDAVEDRTLTRALEGDPKERAELTMIIDVERNDLGRVAEPGSVRVIQGPQVVTHRTIHHRVAWIAARTRAGVSREQVLSSMVPSGSVTGAPKVRAMEVIAGLESARRGLYTGGFGYAAHDGTMTLAMAIRTAVLHGNEGDYWTGGGIVADSEPTREVEETRWKAVQLMDAARGTS